MYLTVRVRDWRGSAAVPKEWSVSGTPESPTVDADAETGTPEKIVNCLRCKLARFIGECLKLAAEMAPLASKPSLRCKLARLYVR